MQFALQDLRKWGYKKIFMNFYTTASGRDNFLKSIKTANSELYNIKCSAFSFPKKWSLVNKDILQYYQGMDKFMHFCEPMIENIDIDETCQRKFRNQWDSLWKNVGKILELSEQNLCIIKDFGIRVCFCEDLFSIPDDLFIFLNSIISWSIFTSSETNIESNSLSSLDLVEQMVLLSSDEFVNLVRLL